MKIWFLVGLGGALGSMARHGVNVAISQRVSYPIPVTTAVVNVTGCLVIGLLMGAAVAGHLRSVPLRTFVFVGLLGGYTTFSTFTMDTMTLLQEGRALVALSNVVIQVVGGLFGVWIGCWLAK